jgi:NodT family efflux transporter outer membrane factor (OMF) lipoprotein
MQNLLHLRTLKPVRSRPRHVRRRLAAPLAGLVALVAGCTVGPDFAPQPEPGDKTYTPDPVSMTVPDATEDQQHIALGQKISGDWWELMHSKALTQVLQQAIAGNQTLVAAKATLAQAQEQVNQAAGGYYPQINLTGGASRQRPNLAAQGIPQSQGQIFNLYNIGPTLSWTLDVFGGIQRQVEQQNALADFQSYQLDAAYLTLTGNAVAQAIQIASARAQIRAIEEIIADDERNVESVRAQLAVREATRIDLESAQSQLEIDRTALPPVRQQLNVAQHALAVLLGKTPASYKPPEFDLSEFTLPGELPVSLPSELVHQRPDILASESQLHAATAAVGVATAQLYPNFTLSGSFTQEALTTGPLFTAASSLWSLAGNVTQPIFHGGQLTAQKRAAEDALDGQLANYRQTILTSFGQVADTLTALSHDAELVNGQKRALVSAQANAELTRTSYSAGNTTQLQLLDSERLLSQARLGYVRALAQRFQDTTQLFVAMGGGWWDWRSKSDPQNAKAPESAKVPESAKLPESAKVPQSAKVPHSAEAKAPAEGS